MVRNPPVGIDGRELSMVGVDCSIIMNPKVWEASGHATGFQDPMVACNAEGWKKLFRADKGWRVGLYNREKHRDAVDAILAAKSTDLSAAERLNQSPSAHTPEL